MNGIGIKEERHAERRKHFGLKRERRLEDEWYNLENWQDMSNWKEGRGGDAIDMMQSTSR